ncbi:hypothetical protein DERF_008053 [Dermatophagoides farinae]|uniref:Uncharacterized protein n=1 Tax=Dermatophagoides farinae TaxID=6954 RepID=A0A922L538_DERFA|nr:hypothetical protein DERF_008053 [Dermatophagoides farinae]
MHKKYIYSIDIYGIWNLNENENDELTLKLISIIMQSSIWDNFRFYNQLEMKSKIMNNDDVFVNVMKFI